MRIANLDGRLVIVIGDSAVDVERASGGQFSSDPQLVYRNWSDFLAWASSSAHSRRPSLPFDVKHLCTPVPRPAQIFAIGLNYRDHVAESNLVAPTEPMVFTKFASCLTGPYASIVAAPGALMDWEVELVVVIGQHAAYVPTEQAWSHVAGVAIGQDLSDRRLQFRGPAPQQFNLSKSRPGYGPVGPWVVTPDELEDRTNLKMSCSVDDEVVQQSGTAEMIFSVPELIARLSSVLPLLPGDLIFTGTPGGIGATMAPPRFLTPGQILTSRIEGIGELRNPIAAGAGSPH
ncbi:fumarylacetoacetate hydrolase family protein [Mycobacterium sp. BMJ-28]